MGDQQQPPLGETTARHSGQEVAEAVAFMKEITERLEGALVIRDELLDLLVGFLGRRGSCRRG